MNATTQETKNVELTIDQVISTKELSSCNVHSLRCTSSEGKTSIVEMFTDKDTKPSVGVKKTYNVSKSRDGKKWMIREVRELKGGSKLFTQRVQHPPMDIVVSAMAISKDLLIAGKVSTTSDMVKLFRELSTEMMNQYRAAR